MESCIETGIIYYEYMIGLENTDRKIKEECLIKQINESNLVYTISEGAKLDAVIGFIKELFNKIADAFRRLIQIFSKFKSTHLRINMKLVKACEAKIKSMSIADQDSIVIEKSMYSDNMREFIAFLNTNSEIVSHILNRFTHEFESCINNDKYVPNISDEDIQKIKQINESYDELSNDEFLKKDLEDAKFDDIKIILDEYKNNTDKINKVTLELAKAQKIVDNCKIKVNKLVSKKENVNNEYFKKFKVSMTDAANLFMKISKGLVDILVKMFKNYEFILNKFINWNTNTESFYFEDEDMLYLL